MQSDELSCKRWPPTVAEDYKPPALQPVVADWNVNQATFLLRIRYARIEGSSPSPEV